MIPMSLAAPFQKILATNSTDTSFDQKVPTKTEPKGDGVFELGPSITDGGQQVYDQLLVVPFGTDADGEQFDVRVTGWRPIGKLPNVLWVPVVLAEVVVVVTNVKGVAGTEVDENQFFGHILTLTAGGSDNVSLADMMGVTAVIAHFRVMTRGFWKAEFTFDMTGAGPAASGNALVAPLSMGAL